MRLGTLGMTAETFVFGNKNIPFPTVCGHINYVDFSMLLAWTSGRDVLMERNHRSSYVAIFWVVVLEVMGCDPGQRKLSRYVT